MAHVDRRRIGFKCLRGVQTTYWPHNISAQTSIMSPWAVTHSLFKANIIEKIFLEDSKIRVCFSILILSPTFMILRANHALVDFWNFQFLIWEPWLKREDLFTRDWHWLVVCFYFPIFRDASLMIFPTRVIYYNLMMWTFCWTVA